MNHDAFMKTKEGIFVRDNILYAPESYWADCDGRLPIDPDIEDLVLDINRDANCYTDYSCQGHYFFVQPGAMSATVVDIGPEGKVLLHNSMDDDREVMDPNPKAISYWIGPLPRIIIGTDNNSDGNTIVEAINEWEDQNPTQRYCSTMNDGKIQVYFLPHRIIEESELRRYKYPRIIALNDLRLENIASFHEMFRSCLNPVGGGVE
jgi:hypothetical protein